MSKSARWSGLLLILSLSAAACTAPPGSSTPSPDGGMAGRSTVGTGGLSGVGDRPGTGGVGGVAGRDGNGGAIGTGGSNGGAIATGGTGGISNPSAFLGGFFPLAVDGPQPTDFANSTDCSPTPAKGDYGGWKSCGINTIARGPDCSDDKCPDALDVRVTAAGLHMIRAPLADLAADAAKHATDGLLLAWAQMDEPDANGGLSGKVSALHSRYAALTAIVNHPPIYLNVGGSDLLITNQPYTMAFGNADWVADDIYPVSGFLDDKLMRGDLTLVGQVLDRFQETAPGKPRFAWIETNNILGMGDPTPAQVRGEIWIAIIHGARGILYFQEQVEPMFDLLSTTGAVRAEMGRQHATITQLAPIIQGDINPASVGASGPAPLEIGWRTSTGATYVFAVNPTGTARSGQALMLKGAGPGPVTVFGESRTLTPNGPTITDDFPAYGLHIYVVPKGT